MAKTVRNGISINADKVRTLRFVYGGVSLFEKEAYPIIGLKSDSQAGIKEILPAYWSRVDIQVLAIRAALWHESPDMDNKAAGEIIDAYTDKGGSIDDLGTAMNEALRMKFDPSSVDSWKKNLQKLKQIQEMRIKAAGLEVDKALAEAEKNLKSLTGSPKDTASESSNSA